MQAIGLRNEIKVAFPGIADLLQLELMEKMVAF